MEQEFFSVQQAADLLHMKPQRIREAIARGDLRASRVGAGKRAILRIARGDIDEWLTNTETRPRRSEPEAIPA